MSPPPSSAKLAPTFNYVLGTNSASVSHDNYFDRQPALSRGLTGGSVPRDAHKFGAEAISRRGGFRCQGGKNEP